MTTEPQAIEVEVVEIDGVAPQAQPHTQAKKTAASTSAKWQKSLKWYGRIRGLDRRWWPLWVVLVAILLFLLFTVGLVIGIIVVIYKILRSLLRALFG